MMKNDDSGRKSRLRSHQTGFRQLVISLICLLAFVLVGGGSALSQAGDGPSPAPDAGEIPARQADADRHLLAARASGAGNLARRPL